MKIFFKVKKHSERKANIILITEEEKKKVSERLCKEAIADKDTYVITINEEKKFFKE